MKTVVFNADDFGASAVTNAAVLRVHRDGILTSASLMVNEAGAEEAVNFARETPSLGVGLHLVLSDGLPTQPRSEIPALVGSDGRFHADPAAAGLRAFFRRDARRQVRCEVAAQFDRFAETGLACSHVDGHQHLHVHPVVWDALILQCRNYSVPWVRVPFEEFVPASRERLAGRRMEWLFFRSLRRRCLRSLPAAGISSVERVYGHLETGRMTEVYLIDLLGRLCGRTNEIYFHPGTTHAAPLMGSVDCKDVETHTLLSGRVREEIDRLQIRSVSFRDLQWQQFPVEVE